jgi:hypothetical protein
MYYEITLPHKCFDLDLLLELLSRFYAEVDYKILRHKR